MLQIRDIKKKTLLFILLGLCGLSALTTFLLCLPEIQQTVFGINANDVYWRGYPTAKWIALTFDDGPDPRFTPKVLAILKKYKVPATFFIVGKNAAMYPELVKAEIASGNVIGNHTLTHVHLSQLPLSQIRGQITSASRNISRVSGEDPVLFRPPYEEITGNILKTTRALHKVIIMSKVTVERTAIKDPRVNAARVIRDVYPGAIILAHDGRLNRSSTVNALPYVISGLQHKGYKFVTLEQLLNKRF